MSLSVLIALVVTTLGKREKRKVFEQKVSIKSNGITAHNRKMTKEEFQKEVIPLGDKMYRMAFRLLEDSESAKDVLQELFLKLWEKRYELPKLSSIDAYACTVLKNKCLDKIRLQKPMIDAEVLKAQGDNPEAAFDRNEGVSQIRKVMQLLPEKQRFIMQMRDIEGCTFEEIALLADTSENNVRVQLCIARKWVKEELKKVYNYGIQRD